MPSRPSPESDSDKHEIVLVRLLPEESAPVHNEFIPMAASRLPSKPFLGLRIFTEDYPSRFQGVSNHRHIIYPISTSPFRGINHASTRCFSLLSHDKDTRKSDDPPMHSLTLEPPVPADLAKRFRAEGKNLYLHTTPELHVDRFLDGDRRDAVPKHFALGITPYRLNRDDFRQFKAIAFKKGLKDASPWTEVAYEDRAAKLHCPDPHAEMTMNWSTFSDSRRSCSNVVERATFVFQLLEVSGYPRSVNPLTIALDESVELDISLYQQMIDDYDPSSQPRKCQLGSMIYWTGWARRQYKQQQLKPILPINTPQGISNLPRLSGELLRATHAVNDMCLRSDQRRKDRPSIPRHFDSESSSDDAYELPEAHFPPTPCESPRVPFSAPAVRVIALDIFGTLLDRQSVIQGALERLTSFSPHQYSASALSARYEGLEAAAAYKWSPECGPLSLRTLIQRALLTLLDVYDIRSDRNSLDQTLQDMNKDPHAYTDVVPALKALSRQCRYHLVCMHPQDPDIQRALQCAVPRGLCSSFSMGYPLQGVHVTSNTLYPALLAHSATLVPGITSEQVLIVTTGQARQVETASTAGFQTVLVKRPNVGEAMVNLSIPGYISGPRASLEVATAGELCRYLGVAGV